MTTLPQILCALANTNSARDKEAILSANRFNIQFNLLVRYVYSSEYVYGLTWSASSADFHNAQYLSGEEMEFLEQLNVRALTGQAASDRAAELMRKNPGSSLRFALARDLRCGIGVKTINASWIGFLPTHEVQLAGTMPANKIKWPAFGEIKYDGVRLTIVVEAGHVMIYTRNGNIVRLPVLAMEMAQFQSGVYDGEIIYRTGMTDSRTTVSGLINSAMHGGYVNEANLYFMVFDYLTVDEFKNRSCKRPYSDRIVALDFKMTLVTRYMTAASPRKFLASESELNEWYNELIARGFEGIIIKIPNGMYEFKRTKAWVKFKEVISADLLCTGIQEGKGKYEGMIGTLTCQGFIGGPDKGHQITVEVGSGLTDAMRAKSPDEYIGETIEVKYNTVIQDTKTGKYSLFLPRFVQVRKDR